MIRRQLSSTERKYLLIAVLEAYTLYNHAFVRGCGKETMYYWVRRTPAFRYLELSAGIDITPGDVRRAILCMCKSGYMVEGRSSCNCRTFTQSSV